MNITLEKNKATYSQNYQCPIKTHHSLLSKVFPTVLSIGVLTTSIQKFKMALSIVESFEYLVEPVHKLPIKIGKLLIDQI
jgi:hypothetical protein